ncbi:MAG: MlaD family protein [Solirubrobacteraceae bacterium]
MRALPRRFERHTLALGLIVTALGGLIGLFAWASTGGISFGGRYPFTVILPGTTPPIPPGAQVRVAGKIAGAVSTTEPSPTTLKVDAYLNGAYAPLGRGARIHVGVLLGTTLVYLVVSPGDRHHPLPPGTVIPESRVTLSSSLPQALEAFNAATRSALARNITVIGGGWAGLGQQTNGAIADQALDYQQGIPILKALVPAPGSLANLIASSAAVASALGGQRPDDVAALTSASAAFWQTLALNGRAAQIVARFPGAEQQLQATYPGAGRALSAATTAARAFEPLAVAIAHLDPSFEALFATGGSLTDATRRFNGVAPAVLRALATVLPALRQPALALRVLVPYGRTVTAAIRAYAGDIKIIATDLAAVTSYQFGGHTALRITGTLACAGGRNPYPKPGQAEKDSKAC